MFHLRVFASEQQLRLSGHFAKATTLCFPAGKYLKNRIQLPEQASNALLDALQDAHLASSCHCRRVQSGCRSSMDIADTVGHLKMVPGDYG